MLGGCHKNEQHSPKTILCENISDSLLLQTIISANSFDNIYLCFQIHFLFLQAIGCHVVNMDANTMSEGESHKHLVLGLLWQIISVSYTTLKTQSHSSV